MFERECTPSGRHCAVEQVGRVRLTYAGQRTSATNKRFGIVNYRVAFRALSPRRKASARHIWGLPPVAGQVPVLQGYAVVVRSGAGRCLFAECVIGLFAADVFTVP
jgi:hypothetical protein